MKRFILFIPVIIFLLFSCESCEEEWEQDFIIHNNSEYEIYAIFSPFSLIDNPICMKPTTNFEYKEFARQAIKPSSNRNYHGIADIILSEPTERQYIYIFHRLDIDTIPCEEFKQLNPIKKSWVMTKASLDAENWTHSYP